MADNQLLERTCRFLRPTLLSEKFGVLAERLNTDYMDMVGEDIPYKRLNFPTLEAFLRSIPNFCAVRRTGRKDICGRDELLVVGVAGQATAHIQEMVANQKYKQKKRSKGGKKKCPKAGGGGKKIYETILPCKKSNSGRSSFGLTTNYKSKSIFTMRDTSVKQTPIPPKVVNSSRMSDNLPETIGGLVGYKTRVVHILEGRSHGLLLSQIEKMYGKQFKECLPPSWSSVLEQEGVLMIESRTAGSVATLGTSNKNIQSLDSGYSTQSKDEDTEDNSVIENEKKDNQSYIDEKEDYLSDTTDTDDKEDHPSYIDDTNPSGLSSSSSGVSSVDDYVLSPSSTDEVHDIESTVSSTQDKFSSVGRSVKVITKSQCKHLVPGTRPQVGDWWDLTVSHVISPSKLMCSYYMTGLALHNLIIRMTSVYNQLEHDRKLGTSDLVPGCVLAVQEDNVWYRARVVRKINNSSIKVILVDIGRQLLISSISRLQPLWSEFGYLPEQVVEVSLTGVEPRLLGEWRRDALDWLNRNVKDKDFVGLVHKVKGNTVEIVMFETFDENNDIVINSELVGRGYAKYSEV